MRPARLLAVLLLVAGCGAPLRPPAPRPDHDPLAELGGTRAAPPDLDELLARYPLGDRPFRADLLAIDDRRSIFLVQTRRGVPAHFHRTHVERASVLRGSGTCFVEGRSYPAVEGAAFRVEAGKVHRVEPSEPGAPIVALAVFEPPLASFDADRELVE